MTSTEVEPGTNATSPGPSGTTFRIEVVIIPVADFDRAKAFYTGLGWRVDAEANSPTGYRLLQVTPPGSPASVIFGTEVTTAQPGSSDVLMAVADIDAARSELVARGVDVSEVFHDAKGGVGGGFHRGTEGRASGPDPDRRSYASYASFHDSEGNRWILQELTTRLPGRV
ncbi:VOC family protein [Terrabacter sp. Soil811]|uniref:VOC family protein n=1 Tax=Terrabacter sp. Soil811 TaxID=1736419 RepID=UPI000A7B8D25|nr:VOC family protein [Terrabacter sp. Soil811]